MRAGCHIQMQTHKLSQKIFIPIRKMDAVDVVFSAHAEMRRSIEARKHADRQARSVIILAEVRFEFCSLAASAGRVHVKIKSRKGVISHRYMSVGKKIECFA